MDSESPREKQGIQSIEVGVLVLQALVAYGRPTMLRDIAKFARMPAAKAHRYLVSLIRSGLVSQDTHSGRYDLGPFALELGFSSLDRLDPVRFAGPILDSLCEKINETVALAVWGNRGPTIVRLVEADQPVTVTLKNGSVLPLIRSATGFAFAAFYKAPFLKKAITSELSVLAAKQERPIAEVRQNFEAQIHEIRAQGIARVSGSLSPGIDGLSAPVYDHHDMMVAAITTLGASNKFNLAWDSETACALKEAAAELSHCLGKPLKSRTTYITDGSPPQNPSSRSGR